MTTTRRDVLKTGLTATAGAALGGALPASALQQEGDGEPAARPNLLFMFSDQQSYDMVGYAGNEHIRTPHIDAMAQDSVRFSHCYSNTPICTPWRGMLMSGMHPLHNGCFSNDVALIPSAGPMLGQVLRDAGYDVGYVGKWHLLGGNRDRAVPAGLLRHGFDDVLLTDNCTVNYHPDSTFFFDEQGEKELYGQWQPYGQTDQAIRFLTRRSVATGRPFALFVSWHPPHDNGKDGDGLYRYELFGRNPELTEQYRGVTPTVRPGTPDDEQRRQRQYRDHMAMATGIDRCVGRLLDTLDELGVADETLAVFTADHGDLLGCHGHDKPKQIVHDYSARVPMLMRMPGTLRPRDSALMLSGLDLYPTLLSMLGVAGPGDRHGHDLADAIAGEDDDAVDAVPMLFHALDYRGVITRDHTYSTLPTEAGGQGGRGNPAVCNVLFDRAADPGQLNNRFDDETARGTRDALHGKTLEWMARMDDRFELFADAMASCPNGRWQNPEGDPSNWVTPHAAMRG